MPSAMLRSTFSTTTIASSTTMPTASTRPNSERLLIEMPSAARIEKAPTSDTGMATAGMIVTRQLLQEQVNDADHEEDRDAGRHDHFVDGLAHEGGRIIDVDVVETGREALLELRHLVPHLVLHLDDIRAWRGDDPKGGGRMAIRVGDG